MPPTAKEFDAIDPRGQGALQALLVVAQPERRDALRAAVERNVPRCLIETTDGVLDAMLRLARKPVDLTLLDLAIDSAMAPALMRHLARIAPGMAVLVFDDFASGLAGNQKVWPWSEVDTALQRWLQQRCARHPDLD